MVGIIRKESCLHAKMLLNTAVKDLLIVDILKGPADH